MRFRKLFTLPILLLSVLSGLSQEPNYSIVSDRELLATMIYGEARGCTKMEKIAVGYVAINRTTDGQTSNGTTLREVLLKPSQFKCFQNDYLSITEPRAYQECLEIADSLIKKRISDPTHGATYFFNLEKSRPAIINNLNRIGKIITETGKSVHDFYKE